MKKPYSERTEEQKQRARDATRKWKANNRQKDADRKRQYRVENAEKVAEYQREYEQRPERKESRNKRSKEYYCQQTEQRYLYNIKQKFGLCAEDYYSMLDSQNGRCAICGRKPDETWKKKRLSVDHDHGTGKIRGLLCHKCNLAIGQFGDDAKVAKSASRYLQKASQEVVTDEQLPLLARVEAA